MKKRLTYLLLFAILSIGFAAAQTKSVTGVVTSADDNQPVIGATIVVKGNTSIGTITDVNGVFHLNVPSSTTQLVVSFVGMKSQTVTIGRGRMRILLSTDTETLDEVVVTGYGTYKKSTFTGSAATLNPDKLQNVPTVSVESKLAGAIPGLSITSNSGSPGAVQSIRIRGMGSITAGNDPLYVIDGTPIKSGNVSPFDGPDTGGYADSGTSVLSTLNSDDIASITVIKDAAAASLYGSRAANGVIVITTKSGQAGKTQFNFSSDWGFSNMAINYRPTLGGDARNALVKLSLENYASDNGYTAEDTQDLLNNYLPYFAPSEPKGGWTNWKKLLFKNGGQQNYQFSARGGSQKTQFYTSASYTKQQGITNNSGLERFTGNINLTHESGPLKLEASSLFSKMNQSETDEGTAYASPIMSAFWTARPSDIPYNEDGSFNTDGFILSSGDNPLVDEAYNYNRTTTIRALSSLAATLKIWDQLKFKEKIQYDYINAAQAVWWDARSQDGVTYNGTFQRQTDQYETTNTQSQLTYVKTFAQKHNVDALLGFETEDYKYRYVYASGSDYPNQSLQEITNAGTNSSGSNKEGYRMTSFLGRVNYNYDSKYYGSLSYRMDGSSRLARDKRWGSFWSASASWRFSREKFMNALTGVMNDGKLRVSYGVNGTQPNVYYNYMNLYSYGQMYNAQSGMAITSVGNPNLKWEKNGVFDVGLDLMFFNKLSVTADYYERRSSDLLLNKPISEIPGYTVYKTGSGYINAQLQNVGEVQNQGIEVNLSSVNFSNKDWYWQTSLNFSHNSNKMLKLNGEQNQIIDGIFIHKVGLPYYTYYIRDYAGVDPKTGQEQYYIYKQDAKGNYYNTGEVTTNYNEGNGYKVPFKHNDPVLSGGFTNSLKWKGIDFNFTLTYSLGGNAYDAASWLHENGGSDLMYGQIPTYYDINKMWKEPGDKAELPKFEYGGLSITSSRWLMSTDYLRVKNLTFGYSFPDSWVKKAKLSKFRLYFSSANLLTWKSKNLIVDPETPVGGYCTFEYPALRTYTFGLQLGF